MSTLALTSNTLAVTAGAGQIEYNGQFFATDSNASRGQVERITQGTAVASTSGTSIDFTGIPAWAKRITVMFNGVSTSGTSVPLIQLGTGGVPATTGYVASSSQVSTSSVSISATTGFNIYSTSSSIIFNGSYVFNNVSGNIWVGSSVLANTALTVLTIMSGGVVTLGGILNMLRITTANGTDTFDAGSINIMYEG
jgi:hypothetical protein